MLKPRAIGALCLALLSATPALCRGAGERDEPVSLPNVRLVDRDPGAASGPGIAPSPQTGMFEGSSSGLGLSRRSFAQEDGSAAIRSGLVGSLSVSPAVTAGLGLFSVSHDDQREPEFRRSWSAKNLGPRNRKVAAVGLNVRF
jgi:hypothetical protein